MAKNKDEFVELADSSRKMAKIKDESYRGYKAVTCHWDENLVKKNFYVF